MTDEQRRVCLRAIDHFGAWNQRMKAVEELLELGTEIMHEMDDRPEQDRINEELADVIIMCEQLRIIYGANRIDEWIEHKLQRMVRRMDEEQQEMIREWGLLYQAHGGQDDA